MEGIIHGGNLTSAIMRYGGAMEDWLDLSTGINPRSWPIGDIPSGCWNRLPDANAEAKLITAARKYYRVHDASELISSNGTQAIIQILPHLFDAGRRVEIVQPTYGEHAHCWQENHHQVISVASVTDITRPDIAIVVNPNNPDGRQVDVPTLQMLAKRLDKTGGLLIVDEAFGDLFPELTMANCGSDNVLVLKSFGKFFGMGGLRLGFAIGCKKLTGKIKARCGPWAVSGPALDIGARAFDDKVWIGGTRRWIVEQARAQMDLFSHHGLEVTGNGGLFVQIRHGQAARIYEQLAACHILVRKFPDRPEFLRFGLCANDVELKRLAGALERIMNG